MTTHTSPSSASNSLRHTLSEAAERADRRLAQAARASDRIHRQAGRALQQGASEALRERRWAGRAEPLVGRLSSGAQQLARQSMDLAANAGSRAQASLSHYAQASHAYVARQPLRSVLIAAAVGAGLALLVASGRKRD